MNVILSLILAVMFAPVGQTKQDSSVSLKDLRNAPRTMTVGDRFLYLTTYAWRDFAPSAGIATDANLLTVTIKLTSDDKPPLPSGIRMDRVWVLFGEEVWEVSQLRRQAPGQPPNKEWWINCSTSFCEVEVRGGPRWTPGGYIDVVLRFTDSKGKQYLIQAPRQVINATS